MINSKMDNPIHAIQGLIISTGAFISGKILTVLPSATIAGIAVNTFLSDCAYIASITGILITIFNHWDKTESQWNKFIRFIKRQFK